MLNKFQSQPPTGTLPFQTQIVMYENRWSDTNLSPKSERSNLEKNLFLTMGSDTFPLFRRTLLFLLPVNTRYRSSSLITLKANPNEQSLIDE